MIVINKIILTTKIPNVRLYVSQFLMSRAFYAVSIWGRIWGRLQVQFMKRPNEITFVKMLLPLEFPIKTYKKLSVPNYEKRNAKATTTFQLLQKKIVKGYDKREKSRRYLIQKSRNYSEGNLYSTCTNCTWGILSTKVVLFTALSDLILPSKDIFR